MPIFRSKILRLGERMVIIIAVIAITAVVVKAVDQRRSEDITGNTGEDGCPSDMVFVPSAIGGFCLDKYEASAGDSCPISEPASQSDSRLNIDSSGCVPLSQSGAMPWRFISQNQAAQACAKAGKRLATNKEWQQAAWATPDPAAGWGPDDCQVDSNWPDQPGKTGQAAHCKSSTGAYDMIGNVWEWVDETTDDGEIEGRQLPAGGYVLGVDKDGLPTETRPDAGDENYYFDYFWLKDSGVRGIARGGYWDNKEEAGQYALYAVAPPSYAGTGVGFRCAK